MIVKVLCAAALAAAPVVVPEPVYIDFPLVEKVTCNEGSGTAFIAGGRIISAHHVTKLTGCAIAGMPLAEMAQEGDKDFSTMPSRAEGYKIDCGGFKLGETYYASGHASGGPERLITLTGTGEYHGNGMAILWGYPTVIPGMSGGAIFNTRGEVVGVINMFSWLAPVSLSVELKGTSLCAK